MAADKEKYDNAGKESWYWAFSKTFRMLMAQKSYHQPLFAKLNEVGFWNVNGKAPVDVTVWAHSVDG
ncbi:hypothetical protein JZU54_03265, partial [bacterium]|nr:hypothetical protein [bacterium]